MCNLNTQKQYVSFAQLMFSLHTKRSCPMQLVIGNKNYSTWSLRPWLLLSHFNIDFDEVQESLNEYKLSERLSKHSPSCKVPVLIDDDIHVWDSLAICEYINDNYLNGAAWPSEKGAKARARAITAEMHSSFSALRNEMPMNCRAKRRVELSDSAKKDIDYIDAMWSANIEEYGGPWLLGGFSIADCFYAPVIMRFSTYGIQLSSRAQNYANGIRENPHMLSWVEAAKAETEIVPIDEAGVDI